MPVITDWPGVAVHCLAAPAHPSINDQPNGAINRAVNNVGPGLMHIHTRTHSFHFLHHQARADSNAYDLSLIGLSLYAFILHLLFQLTHSAFVCQLID